MDLNKITNPAAKAAVEALQAKDNQLWLSLFTNDAKLTDDGKPRDFQSFSRDAVGEEWFTEIYRVENDGKNILGHLTTRQWGSFDVYFNFHVNEDGKIYQLDIGQSK